MPARNGYKGWVVASQRVQNTGTSPQGTFRITSAFGLKKNPGTKVPYRLADGNDYWVGDQKDPKTYNLVQSSASAKRTWRVGEAERLAASRPSTSMPRSSTSTARRVDVVWHATTPST